MFAFAYVTEFSYTVDANETIAIAKPELEKMMDCPDEIAQEIYHFINDIAVKGTEYAVYVDIYKNKFGRVRITNRTVYPLV